MDRTNRKAKERENGRMLRDRKHAAHLLAGKLQKYHAGNAVVAGAGAGGASVGYFLARELALPFELILCKKITDPGDPSRTIGSIGDREVLMHHVSHDIPQDFLATQVAKVRYQIRRDYESIYGSDGRPSFEGKIVILVADLMDTPDSLTAAIRSIKTEKPQKLVFAVPVVARQALLKLTGEVDEIALLQVEQAPLKGNDFYKRFSHVQLNELKFLWNRSNQQYITPPAGDRPS